MTPRRSERGSVLLLTMFVMLTMALLLMSYWALLRFNVESLHARTHGLRAKYAARAGVNDAMAELKVGNQWVIDDVSNQWQDASGGTFTKSTVAPVPLTGFDYPATFSVTVQGDPSVATVNIVSVSEVVGSGKVYSHEVEANVLRSISGEIFVVDIEDK